MRYLITGSTGLLGAAFMRKLGPEATSIDREDLRADRSVLLLKIIKDCRPDAIINCAAHVNADDAEDDPDPVYEANLYLPQRLSTACKECGVFLVHFSSTGCYGSWKNSPYTEDDPVHPTTVHHRSKVMGEEAVRNACPDHLILRIGWLFGGEPYRKKNFVWQRLLEAVACKFLTSDQSQKGCPTNVEDVVEQTYQLLKHNISGTFNCVSGGSATRFEYVSKIIELFDLPCQVIPGGPFERRAPVSSNEAAINQRLKNLNLDQMPHWEASLNSYKNEVMTWPEWHNLVKTEDV